ncbi:MAG TPA: hypothetical protein VFA98_13050 [Thermoanaerobaculia bacterium]|jgi:hypothetical protein|nr:hypothetical protein [Thermoanaerobaculia bacterium]
MSRIVYKVAIGHGRHLRTNFKKKSTAKAAAAHYAHGRVVKRRRAKHGHGR